MSCALAKMHWRQLFVSCVQSKESHPCLRKAFCLLVMKIAMISETAEYFVFVISGYWFVIFCDHDYSEYNKLYSNPCSDPFSGFLT